MARCSRRLTVKQNIQVPMREYLELSPHLLDDMAMLKLALVGLKPDAADKFPSELSGGMIKRAALARALALDPDIVFLDEPTSGLDPIGAGEFDELIATLRQTLGLTVYMVTHDLDSLHAICDRIAAVGEGKIIAIGTMETMLASEHPWLRAYFHGPRARAALRRRESLSMETRANNALIGLFTLAVIGAALGFVVWFARLAEGTKVDRYQIVFSGSITGLSVGSSVLFNGIRVGQVDTLDLLPDDPSRVVAIITVKETTPVKVDTRARMEFQGLTGGAYIQLYGGSASSPALEPPPEQQMATIYAERSELQNLVDGARDTVTQAAQTLTRIDEFIRKNEGGLSQTVSNVQTFTQALADNSGNVSTFLKETGDAAKSIGRLSDSLNGMAGDVEALIKAVDPAKVEQVVGNVTSASDQLAALRQGLRSQEGARTRSTTSRNSRRRWRRPRSRSPTSPTMPPRSPPSSTAWRRSSTQSLDGLQKLTAAIDTEKIAADGRQCRKILHRARQ